MNAPVEPTEIISPLDRYRLFRSRIEHEDNLVVQRTSWHMASQSFLFTAFAIVSNGLTDAPPGAKTSLTLRLQTLIQIIPIVALLNSLLIFVTIMAAMKATHELRREYHRVPNALAGIPLQTGRAVRAAGLSAPVLLPLLFFAVWLFLLIQ